MKVHHTDLTWHFSPFPFVADQAWPFNVITPQQFCGSLCHDKLAWLTGVIMSHSDAIGKSNACVNPYDLPRLSQAVHRTKGLLIKQQIKQAWFQKA